jgi:NADH-quinone oxidoreductase subunit G
VQVAVIGQPVDLTYDYAHIGAGPKALKDLKKHAFRDVLKNAQKPAILVGTNVLSGADGAAILKEIAMGLGVKGDTTTLEDMSVVASLQNEE